MFDILYSFSPNKSSIANTTFYRMLTFSLIIYELIIGTNEETYIINIFYQIIFNILLFIIVSFDHIWYIPHNEIRVFILEITIK
jgi:hypothetical protein